MVSKNMYPRSMPEYVANRYSKENKIYSEKLKRWKLLGMWCFILCEMHTMGKGSQQPAVLLFHSPLNYNRYWHCLHFLNRDVCYSFSFHSCNKSSRRNLLLNSFRPYTNYKMKMNFQRTSMWNDSTSEISKTKVLEEVAKRSGWVFKSGVL